MTCGLCGEESTTEYHKLCWMLEKAGDDYVEEDEPE